VESYTQTAHCQDDLSMQSLATTINCKKTKLANTKNRTKVTFFHAHLTADQIDLQSPWDLIGDHLNNHFSNTANRGHCEPIRLA